MMIDDTGYSVCENLLKMQNDIDSLRHHCFQIMHLGNILKQDN